MTPREDRLIRVSARMAAGDQRDLAAELRGALRAGVPATDLRELALQNYLFLGFPRAIHALALLPPAPPRPRPRARHDAWRRRGERLCRRIYGHSYDKMMEQMRRLSPDLAEWILWEGYGKVLSRPRLSARLRELCVLPVLALTNALPQLRAHLRGALNVGATPAEVRRALTYARRRSDPAGRAAIGAALKDALRPNSRIRKREPQ